MSQDLVVTAAPAISGSVAIPAPGDRRGNPVPPVFPIGRPFPNPALKLDAGLGMIVLEFRNDAGEVTSSIPSQRVLSAYRNHVTPVPNTQITPGTPLAAATPVPATKADKNPNVA